MNGNGAFSDSLNFVNVSVSSMVTARTWPWSFSMSAYRSRYAESSRVQPPVNALGKKARMTGPCFTSSDSVYDLPAVSFTVKSGAVSPTWGTAPRRSLPRAWG